MTFNVNDLVVKCPRCGEAQEHLERLRHEIFGYEYERHVVHLVGGTSGNPQVIQDCFSLTCTCCKGKGKVLTELGQAFIDFVKTWANP